MSDLYNWNIVFKKVIEIKRKYEERVGNIPYDIQEYNAADGGIKSLTAIDQWLAGLQIEEYTKLFKPLQLSQKGSLVLIRYGRYADVFSGESEITFDNFWEIEDGFYGECRSLVIDIKSEEIILSPFAKFMNLGEGAVNELGVIVSKIASAKSVEITNKLDGSMQSARYYNNELIMSGSKAIDEKNSWRLADGYRLMLSRDNYIQMLKDNENYTFIFEYITLRDAHVVNYTVEQEGLYLIGMRDVYTGYQLSYKEVKTYADRYGVCMTEIQNKTLEELLEISRTAKAEDLEGFVLNIDGHMIKIKCDDYVSIHRILSNISSINLIIQHIAEDSFDDLISKVPESYRWRVNKVAKIVLDYIQETDTKVKGYYNESPKTSIKDFMVWVDSNVPRIYAGYVKCMYLGREVNYIKGGTSKSPSYKKLKDMGVSEEMYSSIFMNDDL